MIIIDLLLATICFGTPQVCHPILVGARTPRGEHQLTLRLTEQPGYGGDVLQFHETETDLYAIHRPWLLRPEQKRLQRLAGPVEGRRITGGCINVSETVYNQLKSCCINQKLLIK